MNNQTRVFLSKQLTQKPILAIARKRKQIVYGARSIQKQIGIMFRPTGDWDIYTQNPKSSAQEAEKALDKQLGFDYYYVKPAKHPGTWKVEGKGADMKKGTKDDEGIVDYTIMPNPSPKFIEVDGIRYRKLNEEKAAKVRAGKDKNYKYHWGKYKADLERIKSAERAYNFKLNWRAIHMGKKKKKR